MKLLLVCIYVSIYIYIYITQQRDIYDIVIFRFLQIFYGLIYIATAVMKANVKCTDFTLCCKQAM